MQTKKRLAAASLATVFAIASAFSAHAQEKFPSKPIRMIVPFSVGSQTDSVARMVSQKMTDNWGQQVLVDNRPGAGGVAAASFVAGAAPDGYTLMFHSIGFAVSASLYSKLPYDTLKDFAGVSQVTSEAYALVVAPSLVKSVGELIALAKQKPGQVNFGSAGIGSATHMSGEAFKLAAQLDVAHVPYKGTPEALTDTMTGRIQYFFSPMVPVLPLVKDGRLRALGVTSPRPLPALPDVPAIAEAGLPGFAFQGWLGVWAPAKTPKPILNQLSAEIARVVNLPDIKERMQSQSVMLTPSTPDEFDKFVRAEVERLGKLVKASGARAD